MSRWSANLPRLRPESDELLGIDALRFIAATGIVVGHAMGRSSSFAEVGPTPLRLFVDLFFVVSGYVISHVYLGALPSGTTFARFLVKRVARLVPLHWLTLLATIVVAIITMRMGVRMSNPELYEPACILPNVLLIHALNTCDHLSFNTASWSISAEAVMYLLVPLFFLIGRSRFAGWGLLVALVVALSVYSGDIWLNWKYHGGAVRAVPSFLLGTLLFRERQLIARIPAGASLALLTLACFFAGMAAGAPNLLLLGLLYLTVVFAIAGDLNGAAGPLFRRLAPLGQLTYSVYMIHELWLLVLVNVVAVRVLHLDGRALDMAVVAAVISVNLVGYLSLMLFETPARRWVVRVYDRRFRT